MRSLTGQTVVVTGAASGIGAAVKAAVEHAGGTVIGLDRTATADVRAFDVREPESGQSWRPSSRACPTAPRHPCADW